MNNPTTINPPVDPANTAQPLPATGFAVCVTTMNRTDTLAACLDNLARCVPPPACIVVSDDSPEPATRTANAAVAARHPGTVWVEGPRAGVCANRNNAVRHCLAHAPQCGYVAFLDDDIQPDVHFFAAARDYVAGLAPQQRGSVIFTGGASSGPHLHECRPVRLSFMCYFANGAEPECVNIHACVFPLALFREEEWDENIFFGVEDAELSLRALRRGYAIQLAPGLRVRDTMPSGGVLHSPDPRGGLTRYQQHCEAARLYVGVKRYRTIAPDALKLTAFVTWYFVHLCLYLTRRKSLRSLLPIIRSSNFTRVMTPSKNISSVQRITAQ